MKNNIKIIIEEYLLENNNYQIDTPKGSTIMSVDIQPEYENNISFSLMRFANYINTAYENNNRIIFLYNGEDTLGMIPEYEYKYWLLELGINENVIDNSIFYDKGYAFFRFCIDSNIEDDDIVELVRYMYDNNINDSRDIDWETLVEDYIENDLNYNEIKELLEYSGDMISIPDLMDFLKNYNNITLIGGSQYECLKEVEIALNALNKNYNLDVRFVF